MQQKYSVTKLELLDIVETLKEFKVMLWGQRLKVNTDHKNLIQDTLGLTSDRVYLWRLLLEEFGPEIFYIKGTHNTVADAISCLDIGPVREERAIDTSAYQEEMNLVFVNHNKEDVIYPLSVQDIAEAQKLDASLKTLQDQYLTQLVESTELLCKDWKMIIPKDLQHRAVSWYHHYLQHPGHSRLEKTLCAAMHWKGMRNTIRKYVKNCHACQVNKSHKHKYGKLPTKITITKAWEVLCVDLIGPYTVKGKDGTVIDFMCLTMIDPASSWFEIVELLVITVITEAIIPLDTKERKGTKNHKEPKLVYFDMSSAMISNLVNKAWFSRYPRCQHIIYVNGSKFKLHLKALCESYGITSKPTSVKNAQANGILEQVHQ
eukprot:CCRYP_004575-RA/>CCRYP_004575-RA protein AED:0.32 eAED:0.33 QI:0/0/0/1/0/0/2/0/374